MPIDRDILDDAIEHTLTHHGDLSPTQATIIANRVAHAAGEDARRIFLGLLRGHVSDPRIQTEREMAVELYKHAMLWTDGNEARALDIVLASPIIRPGLHDNREAITRDMVTVWEEHGSHTYSGVVEAAGKDPL